MRKVRYQPMGRQQAPCRQQRPFRRQGPCGLTDHGVWKVLGCVFISAGLLLLFLCIPGWAWAALAGIALVSAGFALLSTCGR